MAAASEQGLLAVFKYLDHVCEAMAKMRGNPDFEGHEVFTPTSYHEIEEAGQFGPSPVRAFTLVGALTGVTAGFAMCLWMDYDWPLTVGGKQAGVLSLPAYVVIAFELTILFGAIATILGMLIHCRIPNPKAAVLDERTTDDHFAVFVPGATPDGPAAKILKDCGAAELRLVGAGASGGET